MFNDFEYVARKNGGCFDYHESAQILENLVEASEEASVMVHDILVQKDCITFKVDVTMRDTRTVQRSLVRNVDVNGEDLGTNVLTSGNLNWQIRPVINYVYNKRVNIQFFFERTINEPRISSSYRRTSSAGGIKIRFSLT